MLNNQTVTATQLFLLGGTSRAELLDNLDGVHRRLNQASVSLEGLAAELVQTYPRPSLGLVAASRDAFRGLITSARGRLVDLNCHKINDAAGIFFSDAPFFPDGKVAFLYPGEGSQYIGMLRGLPRRFGDLEEVLRECQEFESLLQLPEGSIRRCLLSEGVDVSEDLYALLDDFSFAVMAVMSSSWCFNRLLSDLRIVPQVIAGHSAGESTALIAAGAVNLSNPYAIIQKMSRLNEAGSVPSGMLAVGAGKARIVEVLTTDGLIPGSESKVYVAMDNCPHQVVLVGEASWIQRTEHLLRSANLIVQRLTLPRPYHTELFHSYMPSLSQLMESIEFQTPHTPIYSCTTATPFPDNPAQIRELAVKHWEEPVEFTRMIQRMYDDGVRLFVEIGPRSNLTAFVEDILRGRPIAAIASNRQGRSPETQFFQMLAQLAIHHVPVDWNALYASSPSLRTSGADRAPAQAAAGTTPRTLAERSAQRLVRVNRRMVHTTDCSDRQHTMLRYQDVMRQFLDAQRDVVQAHLRGSGGCRSPAGYVPERMQNTPVIGNKAQRELPLAHADPEKPLTLIGSIVAHEPQALIVTRRALDLAEDLYVDEHTVGGQKISRVNPHQHGLPIMPMTFFLEMIAQAASQLFPDLRIKGFRKVHLSRWLPFYADDPGAVEVRVQKLSPDEQPSADTIVLHAEVVDLGVSRKARRDGEGGVAARCRVLLGPTYETADASRVEFVNERPCTVTIETLYNNLFHGPVFQGVTCNDRIGDQQVACEITVQPQVALFASTENPQFVIDPVALDIAMHPLAVWHLEAPDQSGRIMLPIQVEKFDIYGPPPRVGERLIIEGEVENWSARHFAHGLVAFREDGTPWIRMAGAKLWRFYLPFHAVNFHGPKDVYYLTEDWHDVLPELPSNLSIVRLEVPHDMMQPAVRTAALCVVFSPAEKQQFESLGLPVRVSAEWMFDRFAAKDAARRFRLQTDGIRLFAADVEIEHMGGNRYQAKARENFDDHEFPEVVVQNLGEIVLAAGSNQPCFGFDCVRADVDYANMESPASVPPTMMGPSASVASDDSGSHGFPVDDMASQLLTVTAEPREFCMYRAAGMMRALRQAVDRSSSPPLEERSVHVLGCTATGPHRVRVGGLGEFNVWSQVHQEILISLAVLVGKDVADVHASSPTAAESVIDGT